MSDEVDRWAEVEFGDAELGDRRRTARLVELASAVGRRPSASLPEAAGGDEAALKGMYRFFSNECIDQQAILASHIKATLVRIGSLDRVLVPQDTTELDWTHHPETTGLGRLHGKHEGMLVHSSLAMTEEGVPLGLLQQQAWARPEERRNGDHHGRPIEDKESQKWLRSLEAVAEARKACPTTHFVSIGDREADVYELLALDRPEGVDLVVRAAQDRLVDTPERRLWSTLAKAPVAATVKIHVGRRNNRTAEREADLSVSWRAIRIHPPKDRRSGATPLCCIDVWAVWAVEEKAPDGVKPVEWMLTSTVPVNSTADALRVLEWYACRWGIETWHKVLKSGCQIEARQLHSADRLKRCLAVSSVVASYVMYATLLARSVPDMPSTALLDEDQWKALYCITHKTPIPSADPPNLRDAVRWIGRLGGFLGRKGDGEPGVTVIWKGIQRLFDMALMYQALNPDPSAPPHVS